MTKITLHAGHNPAGKIACGASDYLDESREARYIVNRVKKYLKGKVSVYDCTVNNGKNQSDVLTKIVKKCNCKNRDYDVGIHLNACYHESKADGKTKGVECLVYNIHNDMYVKATKLCDAIADVGFSNRGVKERKGLYFLRATAKPAIIIEVCFVDDRDDFLLYKKSKDKIAKAIADCISKW